MNRVFTLGTIRLADRRAHVENAFRHHDHLGTIRAFLEAVARLQRGLDLGRQRHRAPRLNLTGEPRGLLRRCLLRAGTRFAMLLLGGEGRPGNSGGNEQRRRPAFENGLKSHTGPRDKSTCLTLSRQDRLSFNATMHAPLTSHVIEISSIPRKVHPANGSH